MLIYANIIPEQINTKKIKPQLINLATTQKELYSNLPILIKTKYYITIKKRGYQKQIVLMAPWEML